MIVALQFNHLHVEISKFAPSRRRKGSVQAPLNPFLNFNAIKAALTIRMLSYIELVVAKGSEGSRDDKKALVGICISRNTCPLCAAYDA